MIRLETGIVNPEMMTECPVSRRKFIKNTYELKSLLTNELRATG